MSNAGGAYFFLAGVALIAPVPSLRAQGLPPLSARATSSKRVLVLGNFSAPSSALPTAIKLRSALASRLSQTQRFIIRGVVGGPNENAATNPDAEPQGAPDYILTGEIHAPSRDRFQKSSLTDLFTSHPRSRSRYTEQIIQRADFVVVDPKTNQTFPETITVRKEYGPGRLASALEACVDEIADAFVAKLLQNKQVACLRSTVIRVVPEEKYLVVGIGEEDGVRKDMVFALSEAGEEDPLCHAKVIRVSDTTSRLEIGIFEDKRFRPDASLIPRLRAGLVARSIH